MVDVHDFMHACKGYDQTLSLAILKTWKDGICLMNKVRVEFNLKSITQVIHMRNKGKDFKREMKLKKLKEIEDFNQPSENFMKNGSRNERGSLPKPWDEVTKALMRYVTL